ncbi:rap guanine nucleotide exchange factor 1-like [Halichondria panicea]|uniref:rap guanine nucleotide exchange factor 1-like n=1 Tax=Halichondria panicea TaxID=6063 RepID=UPI00312B8597
MATNMIKTITKNKTKGKSKSTKDKQRNAHNQIAIISNPSTAVVKTAGEGLYLKLTQHQRNIAQQLKFITTALETGTVQPTSRHNRTDLTKVVTALLVQLDAAVTTTYQCFTKNVLDTNDTFKSRLEANETRMYDHTAVLVRWVDYESKAISAENADIILSTISNFELALAEVVRVVYECQLINSAGGDGHFATLPSKRRSATMEPTGLFRQTSENGELTNPMIANLRSGDRKVSWSPGMSGPPHSPTYRSGLMTQSEVSSDEEKRRSGSSERYHSYSEHSHNSPQDWDIRTPTSYMTAPSRAVNVPTPTVPDISGTLPPLPGEETDGPPPPLPRRGDEHIGHTPSPPISKGYTLPRMSQPLEVNGRMSPNNPLYADPHSSEAPPPLPLKKRHAHSTLPAQMNGHPSHTAPGMNGDAPPPIPVKQRRSVSHSSPSHTPTHRPHITADSYDPREVPPGGVGKELPPVPMRIESIPWVKNALVQDSPPPKPPRTDRPPDIPSPHHTPQHVPRPSMATPTSRQEEVFNAVRKFNEDVIKARTSGPGQAPPVPLKKKTVLQYKNLIQGYTYDESIMQMQPLYIPGMDAPPPLPPKKRKRRKQAQVAGGLPALSDNAVTPRNSDPKPDALNASTDDIENEAAEVNYLELEDSSSYLIFNREEDGQYTLMGGPIDALIAYAASSTKAVRHFSEAFLLTYSTFITAADLIMKLLTRQDFFYKSKTRAIWESTTSLLVRALTGLKQVLTQEAQVQLIDMVHRMITDGNLKFAQLLRNALVDKLNQLLPENKSTIPLGLALSARTKYTRKLSILDFQADDLAQQMTILDNELFQKVDVCEMLYFAKDQNEEKSPMLTQFTMHFNNVSQWTKVVLLKKGTDMKARSKLMMHFIAIMKCLRDNYNNFNSYLAVLSAIESASVTRLDWSDKVLKALEEPRQLIDNRGSFKNYRVAFAQAKPPCIPYIGLYLQDLTFIEMQPSKLEEGEGINFTKRWKQFKSVDHIRFAQTKQYTYDPDPEILSLFSNFEVEVTDEELWSISNEIKPSNRAARAAAATNS